MTERVQGGKEKEAETKLRASLDGLAKEYPGQGFVAIHLNELGCCNFLYGDMTLQKMVYAATCLLYDLQRMAVREGIPPQVVAALCKEIAEDVVREEREREQGEATGGKEPTFH